MTTAPSRIRLRGFHRHQLRTTTTARTVGVHCHADTIEALIQWAITHDLRPSGAAHVLLRQALGLPPIDTINPE